MTAEGTAGKRPPQARLVATNRRARHDFEIEETFEAGIQLAGSEVKSLRLGRADLADAYAEIAGGELWLSHLHIQEYQASPYRLAPTRRRKLLLHRAELDRLAGRVTRKGMTLVPLKLFFNDRGWAKIELALARRRKVHDRRDDLRKRADRRAIREAGGR